MLKLKYFFFQKNTAPNSNIHHLQLDGRYVFKKATAGEHTETPATVMYGGTFVHMASWVTSSR